MNNLTPALRKILEAAGYEWLRSGKGDHQIWQHRTTGKRVVLDAKIRSRHTANGILKEAKLPKAF